MSSNDDIIATAASLLYTIQGKKKKKNDGKGIMMEKGIMEEMKEGTRGKTMMRIRRVGRILGASGNSASRYTYN